MRHFDPSSLNPNTVVAIHRPAWFSDLSKDQVKSLPPGLTIAEMIAAFDVAPEFAEHGRVLLYDPARVNYGPLGTIQINPEHPNAIQDLPPGCWHLVRPKAGSRAFITVGGGDGDAVKLAATAALVLFAAVVSAPWGGAALLTSALAISAEAAGIAATVAGAAILVGGSIGLSFLSKPVTGAPTGGIGSGGNGLPLGQAGIGQNPLGSDKQIPEVLGIGFRASPPLLAKPYTKQDGDDEWLHFTVGMFGEYDIDNTRINESLLADLPADTYEIETRVGADDDDPLTINIQSVFQEDINLPMSTHRLKPDNVTLVPPATGSYPQEHIFRGARRCARFRITLEWPQGLFLEGNGAVLLAFRLRMRKVGTVDWINLPELHFEAVRRRAMRQEIWFVFGGDEIEDELAAVSDDQATRWRRAYAKNSEWTASTYFNAAPAATDINCSHIVRAANAIYFHLHTDDFDVDQYDFGIKRSAEFTVGYAGPANYPGGMFTHTGGTDPLFTIANQGPRHAETYIRSYTTFRDEYPIRARNVALISGRIRNFRVNSISAEWTRLIEGGPTDNPGTLLRHILTGPGNPRPLTEDELDELAFFETHCTDNSLSFNGMFDSGSVETAAMAVAQCGDAVIRMLDKWGVFIDKDRSAEGVSAVYNQRNMTKPLLVTQNYLDGARGIIPSFNDSTRDYAVNEAGAPLFDDGVSSANALAEARYYKGLVTEVDALRRAKIDLRRDRMRPRVYTFEVHQNHLPRGKGDLVAIANDFLLQCYAQGRVKSFTSSGGNLVDITLDSNVADVPITDTENIFEVGEELFDLADIFDTDSGVQVGLQIELASGAVTTIPISGVSDATLTVEGTVAVPSGWGAPLFKERGCIANVGPRDRESRRVIITGIKPKLDHFADIQAVDEASEIFQNL